jgi:GNAT superfamily N-acetyltransferase
MNIAARDLTASRKMRARTPHIEVRVAALDDVPAIVDLIETFFYRTTWAQVTRFKRDSALKWLRYAIPAGYAPHAVAYDGDELVGVSSYHVFETYTDKIAVMDETYVLPRLRRTDLGRRLIALIIDLARAEGSVVMNFPIASGLPEQNSLMNMVGRHFGAEPVGMIFRKVL